MEYINNYTLWTNHMRRTYTDDTGRRTEISPDVSL